MKPSPANDNLIEQTRRLWRSRLGRDVSCEDARQIVENVTGFFAVLAEWSNAERTAANDNEAPSKSNDCEVRHDR
ncbi:hypothetical protein EDC22_1144 [Tepidamorphus gemmatus]|uniref:Uncharacterized protein n=1 Tax=Tepidamorphus gemmatus TaxID=747076 RepID=A0A4R3LW93_9HYPH|nr:hypothetical protein [Tepidamorphus gemmatus]TCT04910.1 hypothetical protein EDC22_1144 [Tepidamorphus gemmatus]